MECHVPCVLVAAKDDTMVAGQMQESAAALAAKSRALCADLVFTDLMFTDLMFTDLMFNDLVFTDLMVTDIQLIFWRSGGYGVSRTVRASSSERGHDGSGADARVGGGPKP